jgi:hypothetical protein
MPRLRALAAVAALVAGAGTWALAAPEGAGAPTGPAGATPAARKVSVRVGDRVEFAVDPETGAAGRWRLDGAAVASGPTWTFAPSPADVGRHVVLLAVPTGEGPSTRRWDVRVTPPRLPRVAAASPAEGTVSVEVDREVVLRFDVRPATPGETVRVVWTVDGAPAGEGSTLRWRGREPANVRARAVALGSFGAAVGREWSILVRVRPTTTTTIAPTREAERVEPIGPLPPTASERARGEIAAERRAPADVARAEPEGRQEPEARPEPETLQEPAPEDEPLREAPATTEPPRREVERAELPTTTLLPPPPTTLPPLPPTTLPPPPPTTLPPPPPPPPPPPTVSPTTLPPEALASRGAERPPPGGDEEIRRLLDRYAAAWRNHDVGELRRIGQVTSDSQAADLERYFAKVEDLDVEVNVIEIRDEGDRATVRFTRRDRFRDPSGRLVTQESPTIEKRVVRSADGLRFEPRAR